MRKCQVVYIQDAPCKPEPTALLQGTWGSSALRFSLSPLILSGASPQAPRHVRRQGFSHG